LLIEKGADVNAPESTRLTPLHIAAMFGHGDVASMLLAEGVDVNAKDNTNSTPLHYATKRGHRSIASILIENGADENAEDNKGKKPADLYRGGRRMKKRTGKAPKHSKRKSKKSRK
jgi:ankyrin repeat protein